MSSLTNEQISRTLQIYSQLGFSKTQFLKGKNVLDIFRVLKFKPEIGVDGSRKQTPYELLGVPPQIVDGKEKPIVFAIKNKTNKIGHYTGEVVDFIFKPKRVMEEDSLLETLKINYKHALMFGTEEEAAKYLDLINDFTGGKADEFLRSFYDYSKFYRKMKKQLIIDIFAHFFLIYMSAASLTIKEGVVRSGRFRPYRDDSSLPVMDVDENRSFGGTQMEGMPVLKNISVDKTFAREEMFEEYKQAEEIDNFSQLKQNSVDGSQEMNVMPPDMGLGDPSIIDEFNKLLFKFTKKRKHNLKGFRRYGRVHGNSEKLKENPESNDKYLKQEDQNEFDFQS